MEQWRQWVQPELRSAEKRLSELQAERDGLPVADTRPDFSQPGYRSEASAMPETEKWVQVDLGRVMPVDDIVLMPAVLPSPSGTAVPVGFPVRFRVEVSTREDFAESETVQDFTAEDFPDPGPMPVILRKAGREARYVRVTALKLRGEPDNYFFALGELAVCSGNRNVAEGMPVRALDAFDSPRWSLRGLIDGTSVAGRPVESRSLPTNGYHGREEQSADVAQWVQVDLGATVPVDEIRLVPARPVDFPDTIGFGFPLRFKVQAAEDAEFSQPRTIADNTSADFPNPGDRRVVLPAGGQTGRFVRLTAVKLWPRNRSPRDFVFALAEMEIISRGVNVALEKPVTESSPLGMVASRWSASYLVDGVAPREGVGTYAEWLAALARRQAIDAELVPLTARVASLRERAESRLAWIACGAVSALILTVVVVIWLGRLRQQRQTRRLRTRIAQDLHDEIGSNLSSIGLLSQLAVEASPDAGMMREELEEIRRVAAQTADSMHDIVWLISPGRKTAGDLASRLRETAALLLAGLEWSMKVDGLGGANSLAMESQRDLFLIFKEALHNIRRHSGAHRVEISLTQSGRELLLCITDDGPGFDPAAVRRGQGLDNMERRAAACRGRLKLESSPQRGSILTLSIPLKR